MENTVFGILNKVNCNDHTEKKNGLTYLSWAWAWKEVKDRYPNANFEVCENKDGWNYFTDGKTAWVKTSVTIEELTHTLTLPVMDYKNRSIPLEAVTSFDVNKAIMRCLVKTIGLFGLGLYIYSGEDLPEGEVTPAPAPVQRLSQAQEVNAFLKTHSIDPSKVVDWLGKYAEGSKVNDLSADAYRALVEYLESIANGD